MPAKATPLFLIYAGAALGGLLYRVVSRCPPTLEDFSSYESLGVPYNKRHFFLATGVSMLMTRQAAITLARRHDLGDAIAVVDPGAEGVTWTRSGGPRHVTEWATPEILLGRVLECERYE
jgi:hypothetical protein